jgi:hypothetical protein
MEYVCLLLLAYIVWCCIVPPKWYRDRKAAHAEKQSKKPPKFKRAVFRGIVVDGIKYHRGPIYGYIVGFKPTPIVFDKLIDGDYSQTVYTRLDFNGTLHQYPTQAQAEGSFVNGDFGILAITMTEGRIQFGNILPARMKPETQVLLEVSFMVAD